MTRLRRLWHSFWQWLRPNHCPQCGGRFVDCFIKLPVGDVCWRCYVRENFVEVPRPEPEPIETILERLSAEVPREEWDKLPPDLTDHLDHYIYGTPKRGNETCTE